MGVTGFGKTKGVIITAGTWLCNDKNKDVFIVKLTEIGQL